MDGASGAARLPVLRGDVAGRSLECLLRQQKHAARTALGARQCFDLRPFDEVVFTLVSTAVDDLVTDAAARSHGYGAALFDWLVAEARRLDCRQLSLDSGVQRFDAHRFYLRKRMSITAHHFTLKLVED